MITLNSAFDNDLIMILEFKGEEIAERNNDGDLVFKNNMMENFVMKNWYNIMVDATGSGVYEVIGIITKL